MNQPIPRSISRVARGGIEIEWSDGVRSGYTPRLLRDACPCATCRERRAQPSPPVLLPVLSPEEVAPLAIVGMKPVGQYAYAIDFSDGHSSGIYALDYLRELAASGDRPGLNP
jgi:DUF971 family protein